MGGGGGGNNGFVTSPFADVGEYLKEDVTQVRVERGFWTKSEATDGFHTVGTNPNNKIVLGTDGVATIDFVGGDRTSLVFPCEHELPSTRGCSWLSIRRYRHPCRPRLNLRVLFLGWLQCNEPKQIVG